VQSNSAPYRSLPIPRIFGLPVFGSMTGSCVFGSITTPAAWARFQPASAVLTQSLFPACSKFAQYPVQ
jgi:hypothetical protein